MLYFHVPEVAEKKKVKKKMVQQSTSFYIFSQEKSEK